VGLFSHIAIRVYGSQNVTLYCLLEFKLDLEIHTLVKYEILNYIIKHDVMNANGGLEVWLHHS
jgi:hypothetical protein